MSLRTQLPPPPPPVEIRAWPGQEAMLADRAGVLAELVRRHMSLGRLALLWLWAVLCALGWSLVGAAMTAFEQTSDFFSAVLALILVVMGVCCVVPAVVLVAVGLRRDRDIRRLLVSWGELGRDPARDAGLRRPGTALVWLLPSYALCALGLYMCFAFPAAEEAVKESYGLVALVMGLGMIAWITGLIGLVKAFAHRRWVMRVLAGAPGPQPLFSTGGGAHR
ncbi:hypothetical protein ACF1BP_11395 [Streptomyces sp. NPDC014735]|uniref:hypothetical protein n=1 Tax=unclassified Streptomyces TaxID=2593676 RepID=UPI0036FF4EB1